MIMNNTYLTNMPTWIRTFVEDTLIGEVFNIKVCNKGVFNNKILNKDVITRKYLIRM